MDDITIRKEVYRKITHLLKSGVDLYPIFQKLTIPKTVNMNGITLNLSVIPIQDIHALREILQPIAYSSPEPDEVEVTTPQPPPIPETKTTKPTYKPLRLTKLQKLILSV